MDTRSFVKILRKVIREEVGKAVKQALNETKIPDNQVISHGINLKEIADNPSSYETRPRTKKKTYSKNNMLNDILNETAFDGDFASMTEGPRVGLDDEWPNMGPTRTSQMIQPTTGVNGEVADLSNPDVKAVHDAVNRDYSGLIKAIGKKNGRMGTR